jgi:hypothetical protein
MEGGSWCRRVSYQLCSSGFSWYCLRCDRARRWRATRRFAGFHTKHRETRDLDLFFHHQQGLGAIVSDATQALKAAGLAVAPVRSSAMFVQLDVRRDVESTIQETMSKSPEQVRTERRNRGHR